MTVITVHSDSRVTKDTTFQRSLLSAILDADYAYTAISESEVVLASPDTKLPQYAFHGRLFDVAADGTLSGIVNRIEIFANAAAVDPSVIHQVDGEQLLADIDASARAGSGALSIENYRNFYGLLASFGFGNEIQGSNGPDTLEPLVTTGIIKGFGGGDVFLFYGGITYDGGRGVDFLDVSASGRRVGVDLQQMQASDGNISDLVSIEGVIGGAGDDVITGNGKKNKLQGNDGNDEVDGGGGKDRIFGNDGNDNLKGGGGNDKIFAGDGDDNARGGQGNDLIDGGRGNDNLSGEAGNDELLGGAGSDFIEGGDGEDTLRGGDGDDILEAGRDADRLFGGRGSDSLKGRTGSDLLNGGDGRDYLDGGEGDDELIGGKGFDKLIGGADNDDLWGLGGNDRFIFFPRFGSDTIHDFDKGFDKIRIVADRADVSVSQQGQHTNITVAGDTIADTGAITVLNVSLTIDDLQIF
jgi:Ca2+-binding RTX toxin-like protein